jgi:hypothetical protein
MAYKTLQIEPSRATVLPGALVRREQTSAEDLATAEGVKAATDRMKRQVQDLSASVGLFQRAIMFKDIPCTAAGNIVLRHAFDGPANWLVVRWVPTSAGSPASFAEDPAPLRTANEFLTLYTPNAGTASVLVF